ncbi:oxidoreductase, NAD-binding domain protein [Marvinbryantia formatexigens DSM 14469]|uniref:Oxidoreductase, NAD-binding domain protein n=2 Tax=Marvinbryantia TaxID=248744 RepID=C6LBH0_9FIRM|nr:oxidoreductase, NAD-binding domain protein [Marvinbryantia formatexigens DSM 14469]
MQSEDMAMIRFGIIGAGGIAVKFCEAAGRVEEAEVRAVASKSLERAKTFAAANKVPEYYGSYREMLEQADIDAVYVATTCNFHYENCLLCIEYGKAVLCEKSMVLKKKEAEELFKRAKEKKVFVMEAMWSVFLPTIKKAREWIRTGRIGTVYLANYTGGIHAQPEHRIFNPELGGGALYDLTVYPIEIVNSLIPQKLVDVRADIVMGETGVDVTNSILLQYETCRASLQTTAYSRVPSPSGLYGSDGYIQMTQTHRCERCELYDGEFRLAESFTYPIDNGFEFEIQEVVDCIKSGKLESNLMPHAATLQCLDIFEKCCGK